MIKPKPFVVTTVTTTTKTTLVLSKGELESILIDTFQLAEGTRFDWACGARGDFYEVHMVHVDSKEEVSS